jgi:hypothetical protein
VDHRSWEQCVQRFTDTAQLCCYCERADSTVGQGASVHRPRDLVEVIADTGHLMDQFASFHRDIIAGGRPEEAARPVAELAPSGHPAQNPLPLGGSDADS